jgi:hypothetical protein
VGLGNYRWDYNSSQIHLSMADDEGSIRTQNTVICLFNRAKGNSASMKNGRIIDHK